MIRTSAAKIINNLNREMEAFDAHRRRQNLQTKTK
jgi:hypothetical protein